MAKKKSRKRRQRSKAPLLILLVLIAGGGGYYWWSNQDSDSDSVTSTPVDTTGAPAVTEPMSVPDTTPTIDSVADPISVHSDTLGDVEFDQLLDDWTSVDPPTPPPHSAAIESEWVVGNRIDVSLPDGLYWGYLYGVIDEDVRGFTFDVAQVHFGIDACREALGDAEDACWDNYGITRVTDGDQLYPAFLEDLLFTSVTTFPEPSGTLRNQFVSPARLWEVVDTNEAVPEVLIQTWYLLTVIDGKVIAAEGIFTP